MIRFSLFTIILLFFTSISLAQSTTITGLVKDENSETLPGVNVLVKGADAGAITDINGKYSIVVEKNDSLVLVFSYVGYQKKEVLILANQRCE